MEYVVKYFVVENYVMLEKNVVVLKEGHLFVIIQKIIIVRKE
jgi:hypothetical protein